MLLRTNAGKPAAKNPPISVFRQNLQLSEPEVQELDEQLEDGEELEDDEDVDEDSPYTEEEWGGIIEELLIEAALDERIPIEALGKGFTKQKLTQVALSLGLAINTEDCGLVLSRDVPLMQQVEELTLSKYSDNFARAFQSGNARAAGYTRNTVKRGLAKGVGRVKSGARAAGSALSTGAKILNKAARRSPLAAAGAAAAAGAVGGNLLTQSADRRNKKS